MFLSDPSAGLVLGASTSAAVTILNDDLPRVAIAAIDTAKAEGASGTTPFAFTVYLYVAAASTLSVPWHAMGSGASSAIFSDFAGGVEPSGTVTFAPGETSKTISVNIAGDTEVELDEGFEVILLAPAPGFSSGTATRASATILNDDVPKVGLRPNTPARAEGDSGSTAFTFAVTLDAASYTAQNVQWHAAGTGANPAVASDFAGGALPSGVLVFAPGEVGKTVTVNVAGDSIVEPSEAFRVLLSDPSPGLLLGSAVTATASILNDDPPAVRGTPGDDTLTGTPGDDVMDGGAGLDTAIMANAGFRGASTNLSGAGLVVTSAAGTDTLAGVEIALFADGRL